MDFTLHDASHSFRVAQRMAEVAEPSLKHLSSFALSLLLLSAYLHDIGMTPELKKVRAHYIFLLTGQSDDLTDNDVELLQEWLDNEGHNFRAADFRGHAARRPPRSGRPAYRLLLPAPTQRLERGVDTKTPCR